MLTGKKETLKFLAIGLVALLAAYLIPQEFILRLNDAPLVYNYRSKTGKGLVRQRLGSHKLVAVTIDQSSLEKIEERWPWERSRFAELVRVLDREGVKVIGFDLVFNGRSNTPNDLAFLQSLREVSHSRVILAFSKEPASKSLLMPLEEFQKACYGTGLAYATHDVDKAVRRSDAFIEANGVAHYSFAVEILAAYLDKAKRQIADVFADDPGRDNGFFIHYQVSPQDTDLITTLSFYDVLYDLKRLKQEYGSDLLKDSIAIVIPQAEVLHDTFFSPLGKMPGGYLHLNSIITFLSGKFLRANPALDRIMLGVSFFFILFALVNLNFILNILFFIGVVSLNMWIAVAATHNNAWYGQLYRVVVFTVLFFLAGTLAKYLYYLYQTQKIKSRVTLDPLRGIFTLRYFYFKLDLESSSLHIGSNSYLAFLFLENFRAETDGMSLAALQSVWKQATSVLNTGKNFWAGYTQEELVGRIICAKREIRQRVTSINNSLGSLFQEKSLGIKPRIAYVRFKRGYSLKELIYVAFKELKKSREEVLELPKEVLPAPTAATVLSHEGEATELDSLYEDIEEKNRFLLSLVDDLNKEHAKTKDIFFQVILSLVNALEARDPYTEGHSQRVASYAEMIALQLGWNKEEREKLRKASLLHDLGKIGIPDAILHKKDRLTEEEFDFIKKHEIIAVKILEPIKELSEILPWILYHHERWDGKGYPHGLGGTAIPAAAQIISLGDVYDALTTGRDYKKAMPTEETLAEIEKGKGAQFNPELADAFIRVIRGMLSQK